MRRFVCPLLFLTGLTVLSPALPPPPMLAALAVQEEIRIDGLLRESVWRVPGFDGFVQSTPQDGAAPSERTTVWLSYDSRALYVAARMEDSRPEGIVAPLARRDALLDKNGELQDSDWLIVSLDPYHDRLSGFQFAVNPAGSLADAVLFNDTASDYSWDGVWQCAVQRDEHGWTAEMRIPFDQLRYTSRREHTWGLNVTRLLQRNNERDCLARVPRDESGYVSRFGTVTGIRDIHEGVRLEAVPYSVAQATFQPEEPGDPFRRGHTQGADLGLDIKAGLRRNLTLDATFNPDFGQVEADPAVLNLTAYETYYPEKRPFFIEGVGIFTFGRGGASRQYSFDFSPPSFFYSRRIGRPPQGAPPPADFVSVPGETTILGAVKLTGKLGGNWNIGLLSALTAREYADLQQDKVRRRAAVEPPALHTVLRASREIDGGRRGLGFIATVQARGQGFPALPDRAIGFGIDGWSFLDSGRKWVVAGWLGGSRVSGTAEAITALSRTSRHFYQRPDAGYLHLAGDATALSGWAGRITLNKEKGAVLFNAALGAISPGFDSNDLGFMSRADLINGHLVAGYRRVRPGRLLRRWSLEAATSRNFDFGGNRTRETYSLRGEFEFLSYWGAAVRLSANARSLNNDLTRGGPLMSHPGARNIQFDGYSDNRRPLVAGLYVEFNRSDSAARIFTFAPSLHWKPGGAFDISIGPQYTDRTSRAQWIASTVDPAQTRTYGRRYIFADMDFKSLGAEIRINWAFSPRLSLQAFLQPYIAAADYHGYKELSAPRTFSFLRYGEAGSLIRSAADGVHVDPDGSGPAREFVFTSPAVNHKSLRGIVVLRWEFRPGSAVYFVWSHQRQEDRAGGEFDLGRDWSDLWHSAAINGIMMKVTYRFSH